MSTKKEISVEELDKVSGGRLLEGTNSDYDNAQFKPINTTSNGGDFNAIYGNGPTSTQQSEKKGLAWLIQCFINGLKNLFVGVKTDDNFLSNKNDKTTL